MDLMFAFPADDTQGPDLAVRGGDLVLGDGLLEAIWLSIFTDRRAPETLAVDGDDRRGWWGDALEAAAEDRDGRPLGSLWWTLAREKETEETRLRAKDIVDAALAWMPASLETAVRDVTAVTSRVWWARRGLLAVQITVTLKAGGVRAFAFERGLADGRARYLGTI